QRDPRHQQRESAGDGDERGQCRRRGERRTRRPSGWTPGGSRPGRGSRSMKLADVSVKRPVFAIMMTAALIVLGAFSYRDLGLDLMPKTDQPVVNVQVQLPGASAGEVETQITKRVEEAVNTISGIDELRANSQQNGSSVNITF